MVHFCALYLHFFTFPPLTCPLCPLKIVDAGTATELSPSHRSPACFWHFWWKMTNCCSNNKKFVQFFIEVKTLKYRIFLKSSVTDRPPPPPFVRSFLTFVLRKWQLQSSCNFLTTFLFCFFVFCFSFVLFCFIFVLFFYFYLFIFFLINEKKTFLENWQIQDDCFMNESIFHWKMRLHADAMRTIISCE